MSEAIGDAYDRSVGAWRLGPARLYDRLADVLLDHAPGPVEGAAVLDAGAGTGAAGDAAWVRGAARVVGVDVAPAMLVPGGIAADLRRLPFRDRSFDLAVAAFSLGHVPDPERAVRELRRAAPALLSSSFAEGWTHPAKEVVERVLTRHGFRPPAWYQAFKSGSERQLADPGRLIALAHGAGHSRVEVVRVEVATGVVDPGDLVAWRLGMAHHAPFVATLGEEERAAARHEAEDLLTGAPEVVVPMLVLTAT